MKSILSFILVSALVLSATAGPLHDVDAFIAGFTSKVNISNPAHGLCESALKNVSRAFDNVVNQTEALSDDDMLEQAVSEFGYQFVHSIRVCSKVAKDFGKMFMTLGKDIVNVNTTDLSNRLMMNMFMLNMKFQAAKDAYTKGDAKKMGEAVAEAYALIIFGDASGRIIRQLSLFTTATQSAGLNFTSTYLGFLGFIEEANTTIAINDYKKFSNHTSDIIALTDVLETAINKMDMGTIMMTLQKLRGSFQTVSADFSVLGAEITKFVERDLAFFDNADEIQKIGQYLMINMSTTMMNLMRINNALKSGDYREFGHGAGALYNQMRAGAMSA